MKRKHVMSIWRLSALTYSAIGAIGAIALIAVSMALKGAPLQNPVLGVAVLWAVIAGSLAWSRLDEVGREAHKFAWLYGSFALVFALLAGASAEFAADPLGLGRIVSDMSHAFAERAQTTRHVALPESVIGFNFGLLFAAIAQVAGYFVVWCGWWIMRRRR
jgi:hypothetical protein